MYKFIVDELPNAINSLGLNIVGTITHLEDTQLNRNYQDPKRRSIFGHSMGGHGALTIYLKNLKKFKSASGFAPIFNPSNPECAWGKKGMHVFIPPHSVRGLNLVLL